MRVFKMFRQADYSGVSGTGLVLEGVVFTSGKCIVNWLTPPPSGSVNVFDSYEQFVKIHVSSHPTNGTTIEEKSV
jgi:hypothetical protein